MTSHSVVVSVPATSANLGPGFDVLGVALRLLNEVHLEVDPRAWSSHSLTPAIVMNVRGEGETSLPRDASNLVVRAAKRVFEKAKRWPRTLNVTLVNRIPLSRGLGSSAAATIGGLCAANALLGGRFSELDILTMATAMEGHPDNVVPALVGGFCISGMIEHQPRYLKLPTPAGLRAVVCSPERTLATSDARRVLPSRIPLSAAVFTASRVAFLVGALLQKRYDLLGFAMEDVLHQPARASLLPGLTAVIAGARRAGAWGAALSGAGSSVIAFSKPGPTGAKVGRAMQKAFAAHHVKSTWQTLSLEPKGVRFL